MGILEEMNAKLDSIMDSLNMTGKIISIPQEEEDIFDSTPPPPEKEVPKKTKVGFNEITTTVQKLVQDEALKAKVKDCMAGFGLRKLGDAKEEQYQALYTAIQAIEAEAAGSDNEDDGLL